MADLAPEPLLPPLAATHSRLWLPPASLTACMRGVICRDTRGVPLSEAQRYNHFPASPFCSLCWWLDGEADALAPGSAPCADSPRWRVPSRAMFFGPVTGPLISHNPGPVRGLMVMMAPDALHALTGLAVADWVDRCAPLPQALGAEWAALSDAVLAAADEASAVALVFAFVAARWQACRPRLPLAAHRYQDWAQALALRAANSGPGRSLRQVERRIRQWAGQPLRELQGMVRLEQAFFSVLAARSQGGVHWATVAADSGYADQSHLCRATRRFTGFTPQALTRRIAEDESFWVYRIWM